MAFVEWSLLLLLSVVGGTVAMAGAGNKPELTFQLCANKTLREAALLRCYQDNDVDVRLAGNVTQGNPYTSSTSFFRQELKQACRDIPKLMRALDCTEHFQKGCSSPAVDLYNMDMTNVRKGMEWVCSNVDERTFDCLEGVFASGSCQPNLTTTLSTLSLHDRYCTEYNKTHACMMRESARCGDMAKVAMETYLSFQNVPACSYIPQFTAPKPENCSDPATVVAAVQQCYDDQGVTTSLPNVTNNRFWNTLLFAHLHLYPSQAECRNLRPVQNAVACAGTVLRGCMVAGIQFQWPDSHRLAAGMALFCAHREEVNVPCIQQTMPVVFQCTATQQSQLRMHCVDHYMRMCQARHQACCGPSSARLMVGMVDYSLNDICATGAHFIPPRPDYLAHGVCPSWQQPPNPVRVCEDKEEVTKAVKKCYTDRQLTVDLSDLKPSGFWIDTLLQKLITTTVSRDCTDVGLAQQALSCALSHVKWCYPPQLMAAFPNIGRLMEAVRFFCTHEQTLAEGCVASKMAKIAECETAAQPSDTQSTSDYCKPYTTKKTCAAKHLTCCSAQERADHMEYLDFRRPPTCTPDVTASSDVTVNDVNSVCSGAQGRSSPSFFTFVLLTLISVCVSAK